MADVDLFATTRIRHEVEAAGAAHLHEQTGKVDQRDSAVTAEVESLAICGVEARREQKGINRIIDVSKIAQLTAFPDFKRLTLEA